MLNDELLLMILVDNADEFLDLLDAFCEDERQFKNDLYPVTVFYNGRNTTVLWSDDTKTTVGCMEGERFDEYAGFAAAYLKKIFGSSRAAKRYLDAHKVVQQPKTAEKKNA